MLTCQRHLFSLPEDLRYLNCASRAPLLKSAEALGRDVSFADDCVGPEAEKAAQGAASGGIALLENLRFHPGEEANDADFAGRLAENAKRRMNRG